MAAIVRLIQAVDAGAVFGEIVAIADFQWDAANDPMPNSLRNRLGCQIPFDKDFEDVAPVLFTGNPINSRLKITE
jgi:hypothetical protein